MSLMINIVVLWALRTCNVVHTEGTTSCLLSHSTFPQSMSHGMMWPDGWSGHT